MANIKLVKNEESLVEIDRLSHLNQMILDSVAEGIYGINLDADIIFWNKAAESITGYTVSDFTTSNLHDLIHHTNQRGEHVPIHQCPVFYALNNGESMFIKDDIFWRKDGTYFPVEYTVQPMLENGTHVGCVIAFRDMTEALRAEQLFLEWDKLSAVGQLAAGIAHEIRNPITSLKGFLKLMQQSRKVNDTYIDIMSSEFERIETIVQELLTFSKPNVSQYSDEEISDIIEQVVTLMEPHAILKDAVIHTEITCGHLYIRCIANQIKQVFINLIKNAIEAMDRNSGKIHIKVYKHINHVVIEIADNGPGISEEDLKRLGEPFYSTKEKGTGLGIMVTKNIIHNNHHGTFEVKSKVGKGTTFTVCLPLSSEPRDIAN